MVYFGYFYSILFLGGRIILVGLYGWIWFWGLEWVEVWWVVCGLNLLLMMCWVTNWWKLLFWHSLFL